MLAERIEDVEVKLTNCLKHLDQLLACLKGSDDIEELTGLEYSKVFATLYFTLCSLHYVNLKLKGKDPRGGPIMNQLNRVKGYMKEIKEISEKTKRPTVNKNAVRRIVRSLI